MRPRINRSRGVHIELVVGGAKLASVPTSSSTDWQFRLGAHKGDFYFEPTRRATFPRK
jgi:hypothetical protein